MHILLHIESYWQFLFKSDWLWWVPRLHVIVELRRSLPDKVASPGACQVSIPVYGRTTQAEPSVMEPVHSVHYSSLPTKIRHLHIMMTQRWQPDYVTTYEKPWRCCSQATTRRQTPRQVLKESQLVRASIVVWHATQGMVQRWDMLKFAGVFFIPRAHKGTMPEAPDQELSKCFVKSRLFNRLFPMRAARQKRVSKSELCNPCECVFCSWLKGVESGCYLVPPASLS